MMGLLVELRSKRRTHLDVSGIVMIDPRQTVTCPSRGRKVVVDSSCCREAAHCGARSPGCASLHAAAGSCSSFELFAMAHGLLMLQHVMLRAALHNTVCLTRRRPSLMMDALIV
jgi:hypothetical protein